MRRRDPLILIVVLGLFFAYPLSYAVVRVTHALTHLAFFTSSEGLDGHYSHGMLGKPSLMAIYAPLIEVELALHRLHKP